MRPHLDDKNWATISGAAAALDRKKQKKHDKQAVAAAVIEISLSPEKEGGGKTPPGGAPQLTGASTLAMHPLTGRQGAGVVRNNHNLRDALAVARLAELAHGRALGADGAPDRAGLCVRACLLGGFNVFSLSGERKKETRQRQSQPVIQPAGHPDRQPT